MVGPGAAPVEMISQLEAARKLALGDPQVYNQVVPGILPIIGPAAVVEVRRWGADFLAECFASPSLQNPQKEQLSTEVLPVLKNFLDTPGEDAAVIRSVVQTSASIYPLVFRRVYVVSNTLCARALKKEHVLTVLLLIVSRGPTKARSGKT
jgi:symplekin